MTLHKKKQEINQNLHQYQRTYTDVKTFFPFSMNSFDKSAQIKAAKNSKRFLFVFTGRIIGVGVNFRAKRNTG